MQRSPSTMLPQVRVSSFGQRGIGHRVTAPPGMVTHVPSLVECNKGQSQPPRAQPQLPSPQPTPKIQPALQRLPRFRPPVFENSNGVLPLPDSPGSTPRHRDTEIVLKSLPLVCPQVYDDDAPLSGGKVSSLGREAEPEPEQPTAEPLTRYPAGSCVEYKSRSSGLWILARVEGFSESTQTYKLDVQPHAQPVRVRPRGAAEVAEDAFQEPNLFLDKGIGAEKLNLQSYVHDSASYHNSLVGGGRATMPALRGHGSALIEPVSVQRRQPSTEESMTAVADLASLHRRQPTLRDGKLGVAFPAIPLPHLVDLGRKCAKESGVQEDHELSCADESQLMLVTTILEEQILRMKNEIQLLHDRMMQEAALKDRYFTELCICREQLQRVRAASR